jgi:hypothetical protein
MRRSEELALEFLLGMKSQNGRTTYLKPNSEREKQARAATARVLRKEAGRTGYFTHLVASLINPSSNNVFIKRKIIFQRPRGTPNVIANRDAEIAAFMHEQLRTQNLKGAIADAEIKFGRRRSTIMKIWSHFRPPKRSRRSPNKSTN